MKKEDLENLTLTGCIDAKRDMEEEQTEELVEIKVGTKRRIWGRGRNIDKGHK